MAENKACICQGEEPCGSWPWLAKHDLDSRASQVEGGEILNGCLVFFRSAGMRGIVPLALPMRMKCRLLRRLANVHWALARLDSIVMQSGFGLSTAGWRASATGVGYENLWMLSVPMAGNVDTARNPDFVF